jgi:hypothetical protein
MRIITQLTGRGAEAGPWREPRGILASVHHEVAPGKFVHLTLGPGGLLMRRGQVEVGIPIDDLLSVAMPHLESDI